MERLSHQFEDPLRDELRSRTGRDVLGEDDELVSSHAPDRVIGTDGGRQASRHSDKESISCGVAETVVHVLEVVEVDEEHRDLVACPLSSSQKLLASVHDE